MDPYSIFIRPLLDDVTEPATARFFHCRERVEQLAPLAETPTASTGRRVEYQQAVLELADAWHTADVNARSVGTGRMDPDTKRALSRARQLINRAVDERTTAGERENCRVKLIELLTGLAPIPGHCASVSPRNWATQASVNSPADRIVAPPTGQRDDHQVLPSNQYPLESR